MKLVIAILSNSDLTNVLGSASAEGFSSTKIATSGQFLQNGQTTVLFGVEDEKVEELFGL